MSPTQTSTAKQPGILSLMKPYVGLVSLLLLLSLLANGLGLWLPKIIGQVIDEQVHANASAKGALLHFAIVTVLVLLLGNLQNLLQVYLSEDVARQLRTRLAFKISGQHFSPNSSQQSATLLTNLTTDVDSVKQFVAQALVSILSSAVLIIGASVLLVLINWKLAILVILLTASIGISFFMVLKKVKVVFKASRQVLDSLNKIINENILGSLIVRILHSQNLEYDKFLSASTEAKKLGLTILRLFAWLIPIIVFTSNLATLSILVLGGKLVIGGSMSIGDLAAFNSYLAMLIFPILVIGFTSNVIAQATVAYDRISKVLAMPDLIETGTLDQQLSGQITVADVTLQYEGKTVLKGIDFTVAPGARLAIVGPTIAGKSQLLYLLSRMIQPTAGKILFDGHDSNDFTAAAFYRQVGIVFQDSVMFNMSIRENISFSDAVTEQAMQLAIQTAELEDFIASLPDGLATKVAERGLSLSGGQQQRIMLARALAINPVILLLDDFTARVDQQTENKILHNISTNYPNLTLVSVTQKINAVKDYEQIMLLMQGEVLGIGRHETLLATCPEYVQLYQSQQSMNSYEV